MLVKMIQSVGKGGIQLLNDDSSLKSKQALTRLSFIPSTKYTAETRCIHLSQFLKHENSEPSENFSITNHEYRCAGRFIYRKGLLRETHKFYFVSRLNVYVT